MFRIALRLLENKGKVSRSLFRCFSMNRTALRLLGSNGKVARYLYSYFSMA